MKLLKFLVLSLSLIVSFSLFSNYVAASEPPIPNNNSVKLAYYWQQVTNLGYQGKAYGKWKTGVAGRGKGTLTFSKSFSVSNTYSGTLTASKSSISSAVGFNISKQNQVTSSYSVYVPKGKRYAIQYRPVYNKYKVKQKEWVDSTYLSTTYVYPKKYQYLEYRWIKLKY